MDGRDFLVFNGGRVVDEGVKVLFINDNYEPGFLVNSDEDLKRLAKPGAPLPLVARIYQSLSRDYGNKKLVKYHHPITEGSWQRY